MTRTISQLVVGFASICLFATLASAQDNYEIQVYGSETIPRGVTMVELHNNFTAKGSKKTDDGTRPTNHAWHETIEITHGFNDWFETGFYIFTSARNGSGLDFVGTHIRPRFRVPPKWHWPVGVSLSQEIGYVRRKFSEDTWSWEIRPIIDKEFKHWYLAFNPALERSLKGPGTKQVLSSRLISKSPTQSRRKSTRGLSITARSAHSAALILSASSNIRSFRQSILMCRQSGSLISASALASRAAPTTSSSK